MGTSDKPSELDFDALLRSTAVETFHNDDFHHVLLGDMAQGLARISSLDSLPQSVILGGAIAPEFRNVPLGDVLGAVVAQQIPGNPLNGVVEPVQSTLNVAQCMDIWAREMQTSTQHSQGHGRPVIMSGSVLPLRTDTPPVAQTITKEPTRVENWSENTRRSTRKRTNTGMSEDSSKGRRTTKVDQRSVRNRESAAKSRKKRQQYTSELEERVKMLKDTNKELRKKIICAAKAPPDPYAGTLDGKRLRRTRTMPL